MNPLYLSFAIVLGSIGVFAVVLARASVGPSRTRRAVVGLFNLVAAVSCCLGALDSRWRALVLIFSGLCVLAAAAGAVIVEARLGPGKEEEARAARRIAAVRERLQASGNSRRKRD